MIKKVTYENKVAIQNDITIADKNKVTAEDMNEIKTVINENAQELEQAQNNISELQEKNSTNETNMQSLEERTQTNETNISKLQEDNTTNKNDISNIDQEQATQNTDIANLKENLQTAENNVQANSNDIEVLQAEKAELTAECERLRNDLNSISITETAEGENITLSDTSDARFKKFEILGNSKQETRSGKNLLKIDDKTFVVKGVTFIVKNGLITMNGTATENIIRGDFKGYMTFSNLEAGTYTMSTTFVSGGRTNASSLSKSISNNLDTSLIVNNDSIASMTATIEQQNECYLGFSCDTGSGFDNYQIAIQLEQGNVATDFEQYGASPTPDFPSEVQTVKDNINVVVCNKNLIIETSNNLWYDTTNGTFMINSSTRSVIAKIPKNVDITISKKSGSNRFVLVGSTEKPADKKQFKIIFIDNENRNRKNYTFNNIDYDYLWLGVYNGSSEEDEDSALEEIQIEVGSVATDYILHEKQSFTILVQQEMLEGDRFEKIDGVWKERHLTGSKILTREENNVERIGNEGNYFFQFSIANKAKSQKILSNKLLDNSIINASNTITGIEGCSVNGYIRIRTKEIVNMTIEEFKNWLGEQNIVVYYTLKESIYLNCTEEQSKILDEIEKTIHSYKDKTHIYSTDEISPIFSVEAIKDTNTVINNLQSMILSNEGV